MNTKPLKLLLQRKKNGNKNDGRHIALVLEGGGMRGVATGGMVSAFEDEGLRDFFDSVHGSSSGAGAAAYFTCKQSHIGTSIYYEDLIGNEFISFSRLFYNRPIMDIDYLVDDVMVNKKKLHFDKEDKNKPQLNLILTDIKKKKAIIVNNFSSTKHLLEIMKMSMSVPFITRGVYNYNNILVTDGGMVAHIPLQSAIDSGATDIVFLGTRKRDELNYSVKTIYQYLQATFLSLRYGREFYDIALRQNVFVYDSLQKILNGGEGGVRITHIPLSDETPKVKRLTKDKRLLRKAAGVNKNLIHGILKNLSKENFDTLK